MSIVNTYNLFLSSAGRSSGTASDYNTSLSKPITLTSPNNWFTVRVGSVEIPYIFKLINSSNNVINFSFSRNGVPHSSTFTLLQGNYNILTLLTEFKAKLTAAVLPFGFDLSSVLTATYDRSSGAVSITIVGVDSISTSITIQDNSPVFLKCLGFSTSFSFGYTTPSSRTTAVSTQNVNVSQNTAVYIRSGSLLQSSNLENVVTENEVSNILAKVQINSLPQSYILWTNPTDLETKINNRVIDTINIFVGSSTAYQVELDLDWTIRLTIHEWKSPSAQPDYAINMTPSTLPPEGLQNLLEERDKAIAKLKKIRSKLSLPTINETEAGPER
jgi:hypothetical protein